MADFSNVHGSGYDQTNGNFLRTENTQLKQRIGQLEQILGQRSVMSFSQVVDGVNLTIQAANQGYQGSKQLLQLFVDALEGAKEALSKLTVIRAGR